MHVVAVVYRFYAIEKRRAGTLHSRCWCADAKTKSESRANGQTRRLAARVRHLQRSLVRAVAPRQHAICVMVQDGLGYSAE
jgi:hypothetical protein